MGINLLADEPKGINLLADDFVPQAGAKQPSFDELSKEDQEKAMNLVRQQFAQQYPGMPNWLREMILAHTPKGEAPRLQHAANEAEAATNFIPVMAGGAMQGVNMPVQGAASFIPNEVAQNYANADLTGFFPKPRTDFEKNLQMVSELGGSMNPLAKMFGALKGGAAALKVPKALQNATALAGTGAIATPGDAMDKALGATGALALGAGGKIASKIGEKVPPFLRGLTSDVTPKSLIESIQKPHDALSNTAEQLYNYVRGNIKNRKIKININPNTLDEILKLPSMDTQTHKQLVSLAKKGDYDALHKLQSSLYKKGSKDLVNEDSVIETRGENTLDLRNKINKELEADLIQKGHTDIAHVLRQGKDTYKKIMDTYFDKDLREAGGKGIGHLVQKELRIEPKNPLRLLETTSKPMNEFLSKHPEAASRLKQLQEKRAAKKALDKIMGKAVVAGSIGGLGYGSKALYDLLK